MYIPLNYKTNPQWEKDKAKILELQNRLDRIVETLTDAQVSNNLSAIIEKLDKILSIAKGEERW